jgi:Icc-related predicted phosphoesterase
MEPHTRVVHLPGSRLRKWATTFLSKHPLHSSNRVAAQKPLYGIKVICISDTHNQQPEVPEGDILIHSGDLTENGSFEEMQKQLHWLSSLPHRHKVLVAGNHDVLLDEAFLDRHPERRYGQVETAKDLEWGSIHYLENSSITIELKSAGDSVSKKQLKIFGSPFTPRYGVSAFQYPRDEDFWTDRIPRDVDIVVTHGPPHLHLDTQSFHRAGCPYLAEELFRCRPRLAVFGHIHAAYGREDVLLDGALLAHDSIQRGWGGHYELVELFFRVYGAKVQGWLLPTKLGRVTTLVNASVVAGRRNELRNEPVFISL